MNERAFTRLFDARGYAHQLQGFLEGHTKESFLLDRGLQLAVQKLFELIGQALNGARKYEPEIVAQVPDAERYISLRDDLFHHYDTIDYASLWDISQCDIPQLILALDELIALAPEATGQG